jgi:cytochrome P450
MAPLERATTSFDAEGKREDQSVDRTDQPVFDPDRQAWVVDRYADVVAAFRCPHLAPGGARAEPRPSLPDPAHSRRVRAETRAALSPEQLRIWRTHLCGVANSSVNKLPAGAPVDLVAAYAQPVCLAFAAMVTGIDLKDGDALFAIAIPISESAADPFDPVLKERAREATTQLRPWFSSGPELLRDSGFVALALTLPRLLANAWAALLESRASWPELHRNPALLEYGLEELLRHAALPAVLFRTATQDVELNGRHIRRGERMVLEIETANHDPDHFDRANEVDLARRGNQHLTFGVGPHSCVGAGLIRMAALAITAPLLQRFSAADVAGKVEWAGGPGFRFCKSLWVLLHE